MDILFTLVLMDCIGCNLLGGLDIPPGEYCPISLIVCMYKIIAKLLAMRLKQEVGSMVDEVQSTYTEGSNILDGPLIMNEIYSWFRKYKKYILIQSGL
uniref:Reverse transcriptase domain-containing protein n=1 Tax=Lactuca sativa TaxID=4236 RepID=A0A9R1UCL3_LACSA|nr:hypothetical protein LSAT_V11C900472390 [Lactuca sativa]